MMKCISICDGKEKKLPKEKFIFRPAVYAAIIHDEKVLMIQIRSNNKLWLPGGGVDICESMEDALRREVREEVGIEIKIERFVDFWEKLLYYDPEDAAFHALSFIYKCKPLTFDLLANENIDDAEAYNPEWISLKDIRMGKFDKVIDEKLLEVLKRKL